MHPHDIRTASNDTVTAFKVDIKRLVKHVFEDPATAHLQVLAARLEPPGVDPQSSSRVFSSMLSAEWYGELAAELARKGVEPYAFSLFNDPTVRPRSPPRAFPLSAQHY